MSEPNVYGFQAPGQNCEVRVYKTADDILSYETYRDGAIVVERHRAPENQSEKHLVEEQMQIMGATLPMSNDPPAEPEAFGCWPLKGA